MTTTITDSKAIGDAEFIRAPAEEAISWLLNGAGTGRNLFGIFQNFALIFAPTSSVAPACGAFVPLSQLAIGPMCIALAIKYTIPGAIKEFRGVESSDIEGKILAISGIANQFLLLAMGLLITACGAIGAASSDVASILHYHPILNKAAAAVAGTTSAVILGVVFVVRGLVILGRSCYTLNQINQFDQKFNEKIKEGPDEAIEWIKQERYEDGKETAAFKRKVGESISKSTDDKLNFLAEIDKGIFTRKLQQKMNIIIGLSMILGGVLLIASIAIGGPLVPLILGLISGIFFVSIEIVYLNYGSTYLFERMRDFFYKESPLLQEIRSSLIKK